MNTIKLSKSGWIILAIVILVIILMAIAAINKNDQKPEEGHLARLLKQWQELQRKIQVEMNDLKLTLEMEIFLEQKINRMFLIGKMIFIILFGLSTYGFYLSGLDIISSIFSSTGTTTFICCAISFITINRFADANEMIHAGRAFIKRTIYTKNNFDPVKIQVLRESIAAML